MMIFRNHGLVFQEGGLPEKAKLTYIVRGKKMLVGYKSGSGISCSCCKTVLSPSQFEAHAGWASRRKPYEHIYTSNGMSLHEYAVSLKKKENRTRPVKNNNDVCRVCKKGGDLLLCDTCPRSFHRECAREPSIRRGKWQCKYCQRSLKVKGKSADSLAAGGATGNEPVARRSGMKPVENIVLGACVLCSCHEFSKNGFNNQTVIVCDQCEKEYHIGCLRKHNMADLKKLPKGDWFCRNDCKRINSLLKNLLSLEPETLSDDMLTFWRERLRKNNKSESDSNLDMKFVLLRGKSAARKSKKLLAQTVKIFHEGFDPIIDSTSGRDFIPSMVYGRKIWSQDFAGMLCAMLTIDSKVVTAGTLRVFDEDIAELPIVATRKSNQGKGYFQLLFTCIEKVLSSLKIKNIVLPAADDARSMWTQRFGFEMIAPDQLNELRQSCPAIMTFQGTSLLQKELVKAA
ncbi:increased DNA methylation 1-like [Bidens hawaiensis]|uniref:increased DNA methylation 1-like n=1 Tax=Bidens hawaiensis TaxID=980011 RepID=UPI00404B5AAC